MMMNQVDSRSFDNDKDVDKELVSESHSHINNFKGKKIQAQEGPLLETHLSC